MSQQPIPQEFWDRADEIIALANEQTKNAPVGTVNSSLLYAAARFSSFNVSQKVDSAEQIQQHKQQTIDYFTMQYRKMLEDNLNDYIQNFDKYR